MTRKEFEKAKSELGFDLKIAREKGITREEVVKEYDDKIWRALEKVCDKSGIPLEDVNN